MIVNYINKLKGKRYEESGISFNYRDLMKDVIIKDTPTHVIIKNFPGAFGDRQNKNNRVYDWNSLKFAVDWFNDIIKDNPYFGYMFDGHKDDDSYESIAGRVLNLSLNEEVKGVMIDLKINKGCKSWPILKNIIKDGDPVGASMRIISPNSINISKNELENINGDIEFLESDNRSISYLMSDNSQIEYISGEAFIWRFDLTWFPSFNSTFVAKAANVKDESIKIDDKFKEIKNSSCLFGKEDKCITEACKFRRTVKDYLDLLSKNESVEKIKDNPALYEIMLDFIYMNLSEFNFTKIESMEYLEQKLKEFKLDGDDMIKWTEVISGVLSENNSLNYMKKADSITAVRLVEHINKDMNKLLDVDDIFYQMITTNYLHWLLDSFMIINDIGNYKIKKAKDIISLVNSKEKSVGQLSQDIKNDEMYLYDFVNVIFKFLYNSMEEMEVDLAPLTVFNEVFKNCKSMKVRTIFKNKYYGRNND